MENLRDLCQESTTSSTDLRVVSNIKKLMLEEMNRIFFIGDPDRRNRKSLNVIHHVALFLVPQVRNLDWLSGDEKLATINYVKDFLNSLHNSSELQSTEVSNVDIARGKFNKYMKKEVSIIPDPINELNAYMAGSPVDSNIIHFWEANKTVFPKLYNLYLKIICIPATSAASERAFSTAGYTFCDRRAQLDYKKLNDIAFLKSKFQSEGTKIDLRHLELDLDKN